MPQIEHAKIKAVQEHMPLEYYAQIEKSTRYTFEVCTECPLSIRIAILKEVVSRIDKKLTVKHYSGKHGFWMSFDIKPSHEFFIIVPKGVKVTKNTEDFDFIAMGKFSELLAKLLDAINYNGTLEHFLNEIIF